MFAGPFFLFCLKASLRGPLNLDIRTPVLLVYVATGYKLYGRSPPPVRLLIGTSGPGFALDRYCRHLFIVVKNQFLLVIMHSVTIGPSPFFLPLLSAYTFIAVFVQSRFTVRCCSPPKAQSHLFTLFSFPLPGETGRGAFLAKGFPLSLA